MKEAREATLRSLNQGSSYCVSPTGRVSYLAVAELYRDREKGRETERGESWLRYLASRESIKRLPKHKL